MRQLLDDARRKMEEEEYMRTMPRPVYGGPPVTRRWSIRGIVMLVAGALAAIAAAVFGWNKMAAPVYGGPPVQPVPPNGEITPPAAVYGGPPPPQPRVK
ncbi:MAG TPA: hypothetical protein VGN17_13395 [Bryobacteraceae bacterium]|jgi:hypothetical protein